MSISRAARVWRLIADQLESGDGSLTAEHACRACGATLHLDGVGLMLARGPGGPEPIWAADVLSGRLEELQLTTGEGPGVDALATGAPVFADALTFADAAMVLVLNVRSGRLAVMGDWEENGHAEVRAGIHQATGMISVQLGVSLEEAFVRLRAYAYGRDRRLVDVARDIVGRRLRFDPEPEDL